MFSNLFKDKNFSLFTLSSLFFIGLGFLAVILAILGIFYAGFFILYFLAFLTWVYFSQKITFQFNREKFIVFSIIFLIALIFLVFSTPTIFSGRDQGSLSEAAIRLVQNHQLKFSTPVSQEFFKIYGVGKALNFPGFDYLQNGNLITHFPVGYIAWLGAFFSIFGYFGLQLANLISFIIFAFSFYLLLKMFCQKKSSLYFGLAIFLTSFVFYWFFKFTLSENLAWMLLWLGIWQFSLFWKEGKKTNLILTLLTFGFFLTVRIEAILFLIIILALLFWKKREVFDRKLNYWLAGTFLFYALVIFANQNFYLGVFKSLVKPFLETGKSVNMFSWWDQEKYLFDVFSLYGILIILAFGFLGLLYFRKKKNYKILIPFLIVSPTLFYLISPNITLDHPWMLRRFAFSIYPIFLFLTIVFIDALFKKKLFSYFIFSLFLIYNLFLMLLYLPFIPQSISELKAPDIFTSQDLFLIDRMATGDPFAMLSGPLSFQEKKNAVYFFNPQDLEKINLAKFEKIYIITSEENVSFYQTSKIGKNLKPVSDYQLSQLVLGNEQKTKKELLESPVDFLRIDYLTTKGNIFEYIK